MGKQTITVIDAPEIILAEAEKAGDVLLKFYRALGWNGEDYLDPSKVHTTKMVFESLFNTMNNKCPDPAGVGMAMVNRGPSVDDYVKPGKVHLLEGWVTAAEGVETNGNL